MGNLRAKARGCRHGTRNKFSKHYKTRGIPAISKHFKRGIRPPATPLKSTAKRTILCSEDVRSPLKRRKLDAASLGEARQAAVGRCRQDEFGKCSGLSPLPASLATGRAKEFGKRNALVLSLSRRKHLRKQQEGLERTVELVLRIHANIFAACKLQESVLRKQQEAEDSDEEDSDEEDEVSSEAREAAEQLMAAHFEELSDAVVKLLRWAGVLQKAKGAAGDREYNIVSLRGQRPKTKTQSTEPSLEELLAVAREDRRGRARDALCAALATLATRREMSWLGDYDGERPSRGYFAHAVVDPSCTLRLSLVPNVPRPLPTSLIVTHLLPMAEALYKMDQAGPFKEHPRVLFQKAGCEVAFQEIRPDEYLRSRKSRQHVSLLKHEPKLRELLRSKTPVVFLDSFVSLAPRELLKKHNLSGVIQAELKAVFRKAKSSGRAVVFQVGGDMPFVLAKKVYLAHLAESGLRCGFIRWRTSPEQPWAREKAVDFRAVIGLQMP